MKKLDKEKFLKKGTEEDRRGNEGGPHNCTDIRDFHLDSIGHGIDQQSLEICSFSFPVYTYRLS